MAAVPIPGPVPIPREQTMSSSPQARRPVPLLAVAVSTVVLAAVVAGGVAVVQLSPGSGPPKVPQVPQELVGTWEGLDLELVVEPGGVGEGTAEFRTTYGTDCAWRFPLTDVDDDTARFGPQQNTGGPGCEDLKFAAVETYVTDAPGVPEGDTLVPYYIDEDGAYDHTLSREGLFYRVD
jgi:hypothetical protein